MRTIKNNLTIFLKIKRDIFSNEATNLDMKILSSISRKSIEELVLKGWWKWLLEIRSCFSKWEKSISVDLEKGYPEILNIVFIVFYTISNFYRFWFIFSQVVWSYVCRILIFIFTLLYFLKGHGQYKETTVIKRIVTICVCIWWWGWRCLYYFFEIKYRRECD